MPQAQEIFSNHLAAPGARAGRSAWAFSLPLIMGMLAYLYLLSEPQAVLMDGDTYWHIAAGRWMLEQGVIPSQDMFSHTMRGNPWMAHEWLAELIIALVYRLGSWSLLAAVTALAYAATMGLLMRALLKWLEPIYALLFTGLAIFMTVGHALARPHMLAMPLMMIWTIALLDAVHKRRSPRAWVLPVMVVWANMHGGFTLGIALAFAFALEALAADFGDRVRLVATAKAWGIFLMLAIAAALATPQGPMGLWFTWEVMVKGSYALELIGEWQSPNFHVLQPLELWLLGGLSLILYQGLKLPLMRMALLVGLVHLALKHGRNIELLGLLAPLVIAAPFGAQWRERQSNQPQAESADRVLRNLSLPAGYCAVAAVALLFAFVPVWISRDKPLEPAPLVSPELAVRAAQKAGATGPVLNTYDFGGYLIYSGIAPFIDGRTDVYGDEFLKRYVEAVQLTQPGAFGNLVAKYNVSWTLLRPGSPAIALMDLSPDWRRVYADKIAVVHVRTDAGGSTSPASAR